MDKNKIQIILVDIFGDYTNQNVGLDDDIFYTGLIDSFDLIQLIDKIQNKFEINEFNQEISYENFSTIIKISEFIIAELNK